MFKLGTEVKTYLLKPTVQKKQISGYLFKQQEHIYNFESYQKLHIWGISMYIFLLSREPGMDWTEVPLA
ncbi:hypothetical protein I79_020793 [Cricetulus griseus]|uniref:Uncharacterized protein n=1 Tax=Cricetulus griseus TaxID=10029 RepID=G3IB06_CRIGR|nr:hypothetical protein I79_020793 [Cricetulus griseus]